MRSMAKCSLDIIDNTSFIQTKAAVKLNENRIEKLLTKLLAVDYINEHRNEIENELVNHKTKEEYIMTEMEQKDEKNSKKLCQDSNKIDLQKYCEQKLLPLSPVFGFSRRDYFLEYNICSDIITHIFSFIKINEVYTTVIKTNKHFANAVKTNFEYSNHFMNNITQKDYQFSDCRRGCGYFAEGEFIDGRCESGKFVVARLVGHSNNSVKVLSEISNHNFYVKFGNIAAFGAMTKRMCNLNKLARFLKQSFCFQACDVNLRKFCFEGESGALNDVTIHLIHGRNKNRFDEDLWICGKIDFARSLKHADSILDEFYENKLNYNGLVQIAVKIDITEYFSQHNNDIKEECRNAFTIYEDKGLDNRTFVRLWFRIDDIANVVPFGVKSSIEEQKKMKMAIETDLRKAYFMVCMFCFSIYCIHCWVAWNTKT